MKKLEKPVLVVDEQRRECFARGERVPFTPNELKVFSFIFANRARAVSHADITAEVWGPRARVDSFLVAQYIARVRRKLRRLAVPPIETVTRFGYRLATGY